ncbi:rhodanese-like domain-containing protein [Methylocella sp.]|uniref:rhodanese-like domain-containing protein n=1 Tax=Methylocella sp. TaxID=1978226 RepID=UPI0037837792
MSGADAQSAFVENVSIEELKSGLADGSIVLVDVREPNEFAAGHIPGATLNALQSFDPAKLPPPAQGRRIVLSCRSGKRSLAALELARRAGRQDVRAHFPGGFQDWAQRGEAVER